MFAENLGAPEKIERVGNKLFPEVHFPGSLINVYILDNYDSSVSLGYPD